MQSSSGSAHGDDDAYEDGSDGMKRKRSNSCSASVSSLEDSGLSASEHSSGSSSPANADDIQVCDDEDEAMARSNSYIQHQHDQHSSRIHLQHHSNYPHSFAGQQHQSNEAASIMQFRDSMHQQSLMNLAFTYFNQRHPYHHQQMYPQQQQFHDIRLMPQSFPPQITNITQSVHHQPSGHHSVTAGSLHSPTSSVRSGRSDSLSPSSAIELPTTLQLVASSPNKPAVAKKCGFSISAILGDR